jgi:hypothetical protein
MDLPIIDKAFDVCETLYLHRFRSPYLVRSGRVLICATMLSSPVPPAVDCCLVKVFCCFEVCKVIKWVGCGGVVLPDDLFRVCFPWLHVARPVNQLQSGFQFHLVIFRFQAAPDSFDCFSIEPD